MLINNEVQNKFYEKNKKSSEYYLLFIEHNPYATNIKITVDEKEIESSSSLHPLDYTFEQWIDKLPSNLSEEYEDCEKIKIGFHGTNSDKENLIKVFDKSEFKIIDFIHYPIQTFDDKLRIVDQIYSEIYTKKESFSEIICLFDNFKRYLDNNENLKDTDKYILIEDLSNKLKDNIKSCYRREDDFIKKEKNKIDISIDSIRNNITHLSEKLDKTKEIKNKILVEIEEFQKKFSKEAEKIKDKYLSSFESEMQDNLGLKPTIFDLIPDHYKRDNNSDLDSNNKDILAEIISAKKAERGNKKYNTFHSNKIFDPSFFIIHSEKFHSFAYEFQNKVIKDIKTIVDDEFEKWKENLTVDLKFAFDNEDNSRFSIKKIFGIFSKSALSLLGFLNNIFDDDIFDDIFDLSINFDSMKNFDDVKNKLEENFSYIIDKEEQRIEKQKEKIEKSFSDLFSKKEEEIKSKEEEIRAKESEKQNIHSPNIELLQKIEKQADSLVAI